MQLKHNTFASWQLTDSEYLSGAILSPQQQAVIQNDIAQAAEQKLGLKLNTTNIMEYAQAEAELQGRILILQLLLARSEDALASLQTTSEEDSL